MMSNKEWQLLRSEFIRENRRYPPKREYYFVWTRENYNNSMRGDLHLPRSDICSGHRGKVLSLNEDLREK